MRNDTMTQQKCWPKENVDYTYNLTKQKE